MTSENEQSFSAESHEAKISRLLSALPRAEAPGDFEYRVKSGIARSRPTRSGWFSPQLVTAAGVVLLIVAIGSGVYFYRSVPANAIDQAAATAVPAESDRAVLANVQPVTDRELPPQTVAINTPGEQSRTAPPGQRDSAQPPVTFGRTVTDSAAAPSTRVYPKGLERDAKVPVRPRDFQRVRVFTAAEILEQLGAGTTISNAGVTVGSVKENSVAAKAGLKDGDVIEAIDRKPVGVKTTFPGQFSGRSITVRRDGKSVDIDLKP